MSESCRRRKPMEFTDKELALIETIVGASKMALLQHLREIPPDTPASVIKPFMTIDDEAGALLDKVRAVRKQKKQKS